MLLPNTQMDIMTKFSCSLNKLIYLINTKKALKLRAFLI